MGPWVEPNTRSARSCAIRVPADVPRGLAETQAAKVERSSRLAELRDLEASMASLCVLEGKGWPGRKPKAV